MKKTNSIAITIILIILAILACVCLACILVVGGAALFMINQPTQPTPQTFEPTPQQLVTPEIFEPATPGSAETLDTLVNEIVPFNDPIDLGARLAKKLSIPRTLPDEEMPYAVGDRKTFWASNTDDNDNFQVEAILRYIGDNTYFWIEGGVKYDNADLLRLADTFDQEIYPTNREFFGSEWNPGVDNDPRLYILYLKGIGDSVAGYYSSADELHPDAHPYSNAHEMFMISADNVDLGDDYIYGTLAHEFQHMIHWNKDRNEETWVNEGFSMLAELINGYDAGGFDYLYSIDSDMQVTDWGSDIGENGANYGASFLFMTYFLDRFGEEATQAFVDHSENGLTSIDAVMSDLDILNPDTGEPYTGIEVFADWVVSNYVLSDDPGDGRYNYLSYDPYRVSSTQELDRCPASLSDTVYQFGTDYYEFTCPGTYDLTFKGNQNIGLIPVSPASGDYFIWSNMGDESNMRLSQEFDLTSANGPVSLSFKTWYDLEEDYDYVFLSATTDQLNWDILQTPSCTTDNPSGNSYGCGYNNTSNGWVTETVDLSAYAGKVVTLQFDYVTDAAVNGIGFFLDDFRIDAIGYASDLEQNDGGWNAEGFVRIQNALPQSFQVAIITYGDEVTVQHMTLDENNSLSTQISIDSSVDKVVVVISGTTPYTRQKAAYQLGIN